MMDEELELKIQKKFSTLADTYKKSKTWFIRSEELLDEMKLFVAPLLEHRDAFDHLMIFYEDKEKLNRCTDEIDKEVIQNHMIENLDKALGHEYRAFFDIADYTALQIREHIANAVKRNEVVKVREVWPDYEEAKMNIYDLSKKIAKIRANRTSNRKAIDDYDEQLESLYGLYEYFLRNIEPKLK